MKSDAGAKPADLQREFSFTAEDFTRARKLIYQYAGIALSDAKNELVYSRLTRRLRKRRLTRFSDYIDQLADDIEEQREFVNALTTNLTAFFREPHHFELLAHFMRNRHTPIRIWCGAASTGEEAYSIAMTAVDTFNQWLPPVKILASDLDTEVIEKAKMGIYPNDRMKQLTEDQLKRFFLRGLGSNQHRIRVKPVLQPLITFKTLNLLSPHWPLKGQFDAIFLRNVFIYFDKETQCKVLMKVRQLIAPDGLLFIGHSESLAHATDLFRLSERTVYHPVETQ